MLEQPVVMFARDGKLGSALKTFYKPFNGDAEGYSSLNYREIVGGKFSVYSDVQMSYAYDSFLMLNSWFADNHWGESFKFDDVGTPVSVQGYAESSPTIVTCCFSVGDAFITRTFMKFLETKSFIEGRKISAQVESISRSESFLNYNKQKSAIYNFSVSRYSLMYKTMSRIWGSGSFPFSMVVGNTGLPVSSFVELMDAYVLDLSKLLSSHGVESSWENIVALHNFSHFSQLDYDLSSYIAELSFGQKYLTKTDLWASLIKQGVTVEFVKTLRLANIRADHDEHLNELLDLWKNVPLSWFFKLKARDFSKKV